MSEFPPLEKVPGDRITAADWHAMQLRQRLALVGHSHRGGAEGPKLMGAVFSRQAHLKLRCLAAGSLLLRGAPPAMQDFQRRLPAQTAGDLSLEGELWVEGEIQATTGALALENLTSVQVEAPVAQAGTAQLFDPAERRWHAVAERAIHLEAAGTLLLLSRWEGGGLAPARHSLVEAGRDPLPVATLAAVPAFSDRERLWSWAGAPDTQPLLRDWGGGQPAVPDPLGCWLLEACTLPPGDWTLCLQLWPSQIPVRSATLQILLP